MIITSSSSEPPVGRSVGGSVNQSVSQAESSQHLSVLRRSVVCVCPRHSPSSGFQFLCSTWSNLVSVQPRRRRSRSRSRKVRPGRVSTFCRKQRPSIASSAPALSPEIFLCVRVSVGGWPSRLSGGPKAELRAGTGGRRGRGQRQSAGKRKEKQAKYYLPSTNQPIE